MVNLEAVYIRRWVLALPLAFEANLERLNSLDAEAGDGDHGSTILRGVRAAAEAVKPLTAASAKSLLEAAGAAFRRSAGGASGPLFASLLLELGKAAQDSLDLAGFIAGLEGAAALVMRLGKAQAGDRTLLDALVPATVAAKGQSDLEEALSHAVEAAEAGVAATRDMTARRGRARFVNAGQVNSPDAGAASVALMLKTLLEVVLEKTDQ